MRRQVKTIAATALVASTLFIGASSNAQDLVRKPTTQVLTRTPPAIAPPPLVRTPAVAVAPPVVHVFRAAPGGVRPPPPHRAPNAPNAVERPLARPGFSPPAFAPVTPAVRVSVMRQIVAGLGRPGTPRDPGDVAPPAPPAPVVADFAPASPLTSVFVAGGMATTQGWANLTGQPEATTANWYYGSYDLAHGVVVAFYGLRPSTAYMLECRITSGDAASVDTLYVLPVGTTSENVEAPVQIRGPVSNLALSPPLFIGFQTAADDASGWGVGYGAGFYFRTATPTKHWDFRGCTLLHAVM